MIDEPSRTRQTSSRAVEFEDLSSLMARMRGDEKHSEAATSTIDALWVLYDRILHVDPTMRPDRDRFFLSKGHGPQAYYAVLCAKGFFEAELFDMFGAFRSPLGYHPDRSLIPGVEVSSGSLGHGLPLAVGAALGLRALGHGSSSVWVMLGDGEFDEGSNYEAVAYASRAGLDRLNVVLVDNYSSTQGWPDGVETRFATEGWATERADGRDHDALEKAFRAAHPGRPSLVVADVGLASAR